MSTQNLTEEQEKDVQERTKAFEDEYNTLMEKHEVYHAVFPQYVPVAPGIFATVSNITIVDRKYQPVESPYKDKILEE